MTSEAVPAALRAVPPREVRAHGVWYLDRAQDTIYRLDEELPGQRPLSRPERDVAVALLR